MRVAILLLNAGRGSGEVARQHASYLVSSGSTVHFMHPGIGDGAPGAVNHDIELHTPVTPVHEHLPSAGKTQKQVAQMSHDEAAAYLPDYERALEAVIDDVDIVLGHHANLSAIATATVARRAGKPYALFLHGTGIEPRHQGGYDDRIWASIQDAIEGADGILVTTEYVRDELVRNMVDLPLDRFLVLPCGIDLEEFRPGRSRELLERYALPETYVICPGALTTSKGPQNVVEATREYADLATTIFIGDGELREQIATDLGDRGRLLGFVSAEDKAALINAATILTAAPEKKEHFGIIYAEGLAAGTPLVAYEGGGVSSIVTPETGVLTDRDPVALGQAVRALLTDHATLGAMALAGRKRAEAHFSSVELGKGLEGWLGRLSRESE
ncbi:MAG: glycosyltransferase family 4 protein [Deltaproteobacteria bacterium]|nr:glycosyltransferase family 4 protein [Deltaproteobacteria bacterium]